MVDLTGSTALTRSRESLDRLQEKVNEERKENWNNRFLNTMANVDSVLDGAIEMYPHPVHGFTCLRMKRGPYVGTSWAYGTVQVYDIPGSPQVGTRFEYQVFDNKVVDGPAFQEYLAKILNYLIIITYDGTVAESDFRPDIDLSDAQ